MDDHQLDEHLRRAGSRHLSAAPDTGALLTGMRPRLGRARNAHRMRISAGLGAVAILIGGVAFAGTRGDRPADLTVVAGQTTAITAEPSPTERPEPSVGPTSVEDPSLVVVSTIGGHVELGVEGGVIVAPPVLAESPGWTAILLSSGPTGASVEFRSGDVAYALHLEVTEGVVTRRIEAIEPPAIDPGPVDAAPTPSPTAGAMPPPAASATPVEDPDDPEGGDNSGSGGGGNDGDPADDDAVDDSHENSETDDASGDHAEAEGVSDDGDPGESEDGGGD